MNNLACIIDCQSFDFSSTVITIFITLLTYIIIYRLRPKLKINCACLKEDIGKKVNPIIKITVENKGCSDAVNLRIEACALDEANLYTYHFKVEPNEFLILPSKRNKRDNTKVFKLINIAESAQDYDSFEGLIDKICSGTYKLRVRIHSYQSFSGLGKVEERIFNSI